ncbi:MAG TPA: hypothetical protein VGN20_12155 [Mucilaginibacter sp.]|jgi:hypothetical protein
MKEKKESDLLKENTLKENPARIKNKEHPELKTDEPLSEKDEVKQAEEKLRRDSKN